MNLTETFDQLNWEKITSFIAQKQEEHLHLDFKTVANSDLSSKEDRRNLARSISGFANSNGGIIIWGIKARKNADNIDCAMEIVEISKPDLLVSRLNSLTGESTSPIVDGVRHRVITDPITASSVVATLVPETDSGPFMARLGEQRYYKRSGDSFYQMEHFDLEDMFGRRQKARLEIIPEQKEAKEGVETIVILLLNTGRAVARHSGFLMRWENAELLEVGSNMENLSHINSGRPVVGYNHDMGVIHPNGIRVNIGEIKFRRVDSAQPVRAAVTLYCEGSPISLKTIAISTMSAA
jgi:hypothetical protein